MENSLEMSVFFFFFSQNPYPNGSKNTLDKYLRLVNKKHELTVISNMWPDWCLIWVCVRFKKSIQYVSWIELEKKRC